MKRGITTLRVVVFMLAEYALSQTSWSDHENRNSVWFERISAQFNPDIMSDTLPAITQVPLTGQEFKSRELLSVPKTRTIAIIGTAVPYMFGYVQPGFDASKISLMAFGLVLGPVTGYLYANELNHALKPAAIRGAVLGGTIAGVALICKGGNCELGLFGEESGSGFLPAILLGLGGFVATIVLVVRDIRRVRHIVEAKNRALANVFLSPVYLPESQTVGLALSWRF
jgi:hypothetical protein